MSVPHVVAGDRPSAGHQNRLIDEHNQLHRPRPAGVGPAAQLAIFELAGELTYNDPSASATPYADAKMVMYSYYTNSASSEHMKTDRVYMPLADRDEDGNYTGSPTLAEGLWVWCYANPQTGRWEILSFASTATLFGKLDADLASDSETGVTVSIWELNESNSWADTTEDVEGVLPGPGQTGTLASGAAVLVLKSGDKYVAFAGGGLPPGTTTNDLLYWDATEEEWAILSAPATTGIFIPMVVNGVLQWVAGQEFVCPEPPAE